MAFQHLDAAQLLKHALGMATQLGARFELWYLYFATKGPEATAHQAELALLTGRVGPEVRLRVLTYQELFGRLQKAPAQLVSREYFDYLSHRYFA